MTIAIPPGVFDILPSDPKEQWRSSYLWQYVEQVMRTAAQAYGFREIRTPLFERTELFQRGVGKLTDIVQKEMYTFMDKGERSMTLRPEGTASAMRAFIEHQLHQESAVQKLYYICPMFRYERSQAGRYRQHHQFGVEAIGVAGPEQDVETIDLIYTILSRLGIKNMKVGLNSIGDIASRAAYREALVAYFSSHQDKLSADSKTRLEANPLRILDSKDPEDKIINAGAPSILDYLNEESRAHFESVKKLLGSLKIPYEINTQLVRGLDYYNKTVFEIVADVLGAQNSIVGGGRYDGLLKTLGGPDLPAFGFGSGIERIIQTLLKQGCYLPSPPRVDIFIIALGEAAHGVCFELLHNLRNDGISAQMDYSGRKLNKLMQLADQMGARYVAVVGDEELSKGNVELKRMESAEKTSVPIKELTQYMKEVSQYV